MHRSGVHGAAARRLESPRAIPTLRLSVWAHSKLTMERSELHIPRFFFVFWVLILHFRLGCVSTDLFGDAAVVPGQGQRESGKKRKKLWKWAKRPISHGRFLESFVRRWPACQSLLGGDPTWDNAITTKSSGPTL